MRSCEVGIVGLGIIGSSVLHALARRGIDVLGFDPLRLGDARGSSHGSCRIFRRFNFENDAYTELSDRAYTGWRELEVVSDRTILKPSAVLEAGPQSSKLVAASRQAAMREGPIEGPRSGAEVNLAFPAFRLPHDWEVVVQQSGGILLVEEAIRAFRQGNEDRVISASVTVEPTLAGVRILTHHECYTAQRVVLTAGPWIAQFVPAITRYISVTRQVVGWFKPTCPETVKYGEFPIFMLDCSDALVYGFPDFEARGVKAAQHNLGPIVGSDEWGIPPLDTELAPVGAVLAQFVPGAAGPIADRDTCLYTNTLPADVIADGGSEFILDRLPDDPRIIVASSCSGHGAKFAPAIGNILANLAVDAKTLAPAAFRLQRYAAFSAK